MTTIALLASSLGWQGASTPDDLTIRIQAGDRETEAYVSVLDLVLLHGRIRSRDTYDSVVGTNLVVRLEPDTDTVAFERADFSTECTYERARRMLRDLLQETFRELDSMGDEEHREQFLDAAEAHLQQLDIEFLVRGLYRELAEEP